MMNWTHFVENQNIDLTKENKRQEEAILKLLELIDNLYNEREEARAYARKYYQEVQKGRGTASDDFQARYDWFVLTNDSTRDIREVITVYGVYNEKPR